MTQIDRLLAMMQSRGGDTLTLDEGAPARVDSGGDDQIVTRAALTAQQIVGLMREVASDDVLKAIDDGRPTEFTYMSDSREYRARAAREGGRLRVSIATAAIADCPAPSVATVADAPAAVTVVREPSSPRERIDALLTELVTRKASDLHIRSGNPPFIRRDGEIARLPDAPMLDAATARALVESVMPAQSQEQLTQAGETDFAYEISGTARFRVNVFVDRSGTGAVFRQIPPAVVSVDDLGLGPEIQRLTQLKKGLVLVTGPTGSGKSTTLCALVDLVNRSRRDHIITIEDPIEFIHEGKNCVVTQRQVGQHTRSFKAALRAALREDPDVVLIGELRDLETVSIALETAETGHLVFATLHTTTAAGTVDRIIDQFPAEQQDQIRVMLADSMRAVISQTLCKKIGGGRVAAREILFNTPSVANLIRERKTFQIPSIMQTSKRFGMVTLNDALVDLLDGRQVAPDEAYAHAVDKPAFLGALKAKGIDVGFAEPDALSARMSGAVRPVAG